MVEIRVLGPLEVVASGGVVSLRAPKLRRLLAALVVDAGRPRSLDVLVDALWEEQPPASAHKLVQVYVSQLRRALPPPARIATRDAGYVLELEEESIDASRFERLVAEGRQALLAGNPAFAASVFRRALALWRGPAFGEIGDALFALAEVERLEELRQVCVEQRLEAELQLGRHLELLPEIQRLAVENPLRERLQAQAMLALYRCGRQAEALEIYARTRSALKKELGLEPRLELRDLQRRILQHDPALAAPRPAVEPARALPYAPNRMLGRERELRELHDLLLLEEVRLLVLTGAGGSGKTRLALEAAHRLASSYANGAAFVSLAALRDPALVASAIARELELEPLPLEEPIAALGEFLRMQELLLVLDNAEHLRAAAPMFVELLSRAPRLTLLVTSRLVLHLSGEQVYPVEPLAGDDAVALFLERAREADARFRPEATDHETINRICARLDRLPLAIELAATRTRTLTPRELLGRLEPRLPLLTAGPRDLPARQQTLRAALAWSVDLLDETERRDLARLSVFVGGCTLEAAEAVCETTVERLSWLVDYSLVRHTTTQQESRYTMLETVREYAGERLEASGEADRISRRHAEFFVRVAESANLSLDALGHGPQRHDLVLPEQHNMRAALDWAAEHDAELGLRLLVALENFWITQDPAEGKRRFEALLRRADGVDPLLRARALRDFSGTAGMAGDEHLAGRVAREALEAFRDAGNERGATEMIFRLGVNASLLGDQRRARRLWEQSLEGFRLLRDAVGELQVLAFLGSLSWQEGEREHAQALTTQSLEASRAIGWSWFEGWQLAELAERSLQDRDIEQAERHAADYLAIARRIGDRQMKLYGVAMLASTAAVRGDEQRAIALWRAVEAEEARGGRPARWAASRASYAAHIPHGLPPPETMGLDQAVDYAVSILR